MLGSTFAPKRWEITDGWRKLDNDNFQNFYSRTNIMRASKSRKRWAKHAVHTKRKSAQSFVGGMKD
jgi:hypothetical protein